MATIEVTAEVSKEGYELGQGLVKFSDAIVKALKDGWQPGQDLPIVMLSALHDLVPALEGAQLIAKELGEDTAGLVRGLGITCGDLVEVLKA